MNAQLAREGTAAGSAPNATGGSSPAAGSEQLGDATTDDPIICYWELGPSESLDDAAMDDPIICYWELGPEELPELHRVVRRHESMPPAGSSRPAKDAPGPAKGRASLAPVAVGEPRRRPPASAWQRRLIRPAWQRAVLAIALSAAVTLTIVTWKIERPSTSPAKTATALLTYRALRALEERADRVGWPEGAGDPGLGEVGLDEATDELWPSPTDPRWAPAHRPSPSSMPMPSEAASPAEQLPAGTEPPMAAGAAPGRLAPTVGKARATRHPRAPGAQREPDDDLPTDEVDVTWIEQPRPPRRSTDSQTPATPLLPNRSAGSGRLAGSPKRR